MVGGVQLLLHDLFGDVNGDAGDLVLDAVEGLLPLQLDVRPSLLPDGVGVGLGVDDDIVPPAVGLLGGL